MLQLFGLTLPDRFRPADRALAAKLAERMTAGVHALKEGAPGAVAADLRREARAYLTARRRGELRFDGQAIGAARSCDEGAHALMRLTLDAPAVVVGARLVA